MKTTLSRRAFLQVGLASLAAGFLPGCRSKPAAPTNTGAAHEVAALPTPIPGTPNPGAPIYGASTPVTLPGTETWSLASQFIDQQYQIFVNIPSGYGAGHRFPALYTTDGNALFPLIRAIYGELRAENKIPELLLVGIGYPDDQALDVPDLRARDLTPYPYDPNSYEAPQIRIGRGTGGAPKFLRFIREQLKPAIDARYTTLPAETALFGHSFGGLFTLFTLFQEPALFNRYIAASPSIWWANAAIYAEEKDYTLSHTDLPARLFIGAGGDEGTESADVAHLADILRGRNFPGLQVTTQVFDGQGHNSVVPFCVSEGLRQVYR